MTPRLQSASGFTAQPNLRPSGRIFMRSPVAVWCASVALALAASVVPSLPIRADITLKDRTLTQPLVLDQNEDYFLHKVQVSGVTDLAALTLTGRINSVILSHCTFSNIWSGVNGKAVAAEAQGAIVGSFVATDTAFEDAQHQLLCLREGAFGTVTLQRCKFRTSDSFLKRIYSDDPWRTRPPTTEFANIDRLELLDNEYSNTILIVHPTVKTVVFRGDINNLRLESKGTHVIRLEKNQDPASIDPDGTAVAIATPDPTPELPADESTATPDDTTPPDTAAADTAAVASTPSDTPNANLDSETPHVDTVATAQP
jgi:hypothetical protein